MLILVTDRRCEAHDMGPHHPESPARLEAVLAASHDPSLRDAITTVAPRLATHDEVTAVHSEAHWSFIRSLDGARAAIDGDTSVSPGSVTAALLSAGAGLTAVDLLRSGNHEAAFCAVRPPGHHATRNQAMGFCLFNNIAITAAALSAAGERVLIADFDAHHGNGTEEIFYEDPSVLFVSWHQSPLYPGTGAITEIGSGEAVGTTVNVPLPAGTCGDAYLESIDRVVGGVIDSFEPTWLLISAGYDAHRLDPLTEMGLSSGDYSQITQTLMQAVPSGRTIAFLEGGYDLDALVMSTRATLGALIGESVHPERPTVGPDESFVIDRLAHVHDGLLP